jgi:hypothetical protein
VPTTAITVTITGINFGSGDLSLTLNIGKMACSGSMWASATTIRCLPANKGLLSQVGAGYNLQLVASISGVIGTSAQTFTFDGKDPLRAPSRPISE